MASYNELIALINAFIKQNGIQAITGQILNGVLRAMVDQIGRGYAIMGTAVPTDDPGTPDAPESWFASTPGTYTNFGGFEVADAEFALLSYTPSTGWAKNTLTTGITEVDATVDNTTGTPSVSASYANGVLSFEFHNLKGATGDPAGFGTVNATVDANVGTPSVSVSGSGPDTAKNYTFAFHNLKGETGVTSVVATVDNTTGNPACAVSLVGQELHLDFTGLKGAQGNTGSSVDYPFTIVNNLTTDDATQALSAAMGVELAGQVSQLEAEIDGIETARENMYTSLTDGITYSTNGAIGSVVSLTPNTTPGWKAGVFDCEEGERFYLNATGGSGARLWCFIDSADKILSSATAGAHDVTITAPENAAKLIVNINPSYSPHTFEKLISRFGDIESRLSSLETSESASSEKIKGLNIELGNEVELVQPIANYDDVVTFPYAAKTGDVLKIVVSASGVISSSSSDYEPLYVNGTSNYLGTIWDGASKEFTMPVDCVSLKIFGRSPAFIAPGNIKLKVTNKSAIKGRIESLEQKSGSTPEIILPTKLTAIVGHQFNIYFDSILLSDNNDAFQKQWAGAFPANNKALACGLRFTPSATQSANNISLTLSGKVSGTQIVKKTIPLKVIADSEITGKKVIFIGDSLTDAGYYPAEIQHNLSNGGIISLGTRSDSVVIGGQSLSVNHEGRSGWSPQDYVTKSTFNGMSNAFWNPNTSKFDFSYYMTQQGYSGVDIVCLCLGTNGYNDTENAISALDEIIDSIHTYDSDIIVLVTMITPPAEQDGVGHSSAYTSAEQMFRGMMNYNKRVLAEYGNRNDNVDIVPWYINVNRKYDFPTTEQAFSARNPTLVTRQTDNVHPSVYGYLAMADAMYCVLLDKLTS